MDIHEKLDDAIIEARIDSIQARYNKDGTAVLPANNNETHLKKQSRSSKMKDIISRLEQRICDLEKELKKMQERAKYPRREIRYK